MKVMCVWTGLRADVAKYGVRNSLLVAPMPTASTSQIIVDFAAERKARCKGRKRVSVSSRQSRGTLEGAQSAWNAPSPQEGLLGGVQRGRSELGEEGDQGVECATRECSRQGISPEKREGGGAGATLHAKSTNNTVRAS